MIKESVDDAIATERARHANAGNDVRGYGPVRGQDAAPDVRECTFSGFMKCNPTVFRGTEGAVKLRRWFEKTASVFGINECAEGQKLMTVEFCPVEEIQIMERELWNLRVKEYNIVAYTQIFNELALIPANLNEAVCMAHKLMEKKSQARVKRILEGKKRKLENFQSGNSSGKRNHKDNLRQSAPTEKGLSFGTLLVCECCFTRHDGPCMIKCHKCRKVGHK
uniref:Retrotransposon gag domain-containing protein n=1 Tax=Tanacetum cinerariifolium TaxID=118510 RepID=A0A699JIC1_TANCI|nr:hypothetical protein [Tanacetum cinerariifolium]